jgi:hypothetical protein
MTAILLLVLTLVPQERTATVSDVGWLSGCWTLTTASRSVTEHWLPPNGETMIGVSRTVGGGRTIEYEFLLLRSGPTGLEYVAKPSRQPEAVFTATRVTATEAVFENPAHDFPTRITYRQTDGGLLATIDGIVKGKPRAIEFRYLAGECPR